MASKATGFRSPKIAAKLAVGYRLHELPNDITRETPACFEPTIDYVVVKIPRFAFEKFPEADNRLTTQMKSVGETMAIGRTFKEAFQKALRGLEVGSFGFGSDGKDLWGTSQQPSREEIRAKVAVPTADRGLVSALRAERRHVGRRDSRNLAHRPPGSSTSCAKLSNLKTKLRRVGEISAVSNQLFRRAKQFGFSDRQLAVLWNTSEMEVRADRKRHGIIATFKSVDTCAASSKRIRPITTRPTKMKTKCPPSPSAASGS